MTLATILLGVVFPLQGFLLQPTVVYAQAQAASASKSADTPAQNQSTSQQQNTPQAPSTSTTRSPTTKPPLRHKKKVVQANCNPTDKTGTPSTGTASATSGKSTSASGTGANRPASGKTLTPSNCPPPKIIVRQGSTPDPGIQLAGDASGSPLPSTNACHDAAQCLQSAEENLKKLSAQQLDSNKQEMAREVRQFMDQSKAATKAGDLDRARTLAWKAQTLSEELVTPQK